MSERHTFTCGACGTAITAISMFSGLLTVMDKHAELCLGFPPLAASAENEPRLLEAVNDYLLAQNSAGFDHRKAAVRDARRHLCQVAYDLNAALPEEAKP